MGNIPIFPTVPANAFPVVKKPTFKSLVQTPPSGREVTGQQQLLPLWEFELTYEVLRDQSQNLSPFAPVSGYTELQILSSFWLSVNGQYGAFLYSDPTDNSRTGQGIGTGDGVQSAFMMQRTWATGDYAFEEPVGAVDVRIGAVLTIYLDGVAFAQPGNWWIDRDLRTLRFVVPPDAGVVISADFSFFYLCRFIEDKLELEEFMTGRWTLKSLKFRSTPPDPPGGNPPYTGGGVGPAPGNFISVDNQNTVITTPQGQKWYFEVEVIATGNGYSPCIGIAGISFQLQDPIGIDRHVYEPTLASGMFYPLGNSIGFGYPGGPENVNGVSVGHHIGVAVDLGVMKIWARDFEFAPNTWTNGPVANPATNTGGFYFADPSSGSPISGMYAYILGGGGWDTGTGITPPLMLLKLNTGLTPFAGPIPAGFQAWDTSGLTNFNAGDAGLQIVLQEGNLKVGLSAVPTGPTHNQPTCFVRSNTAKPLL